MSFVIAVRFAHISIADRLKKNPAISEMNTASSCEAFSSSSRSPQAHASGATESICGSARIFSAHGALSKRSRFSASTQSLTFSDFVLDYRKGKYSVKLKVTAAGDNNYKGVTKAVTVTIRVK